MSENKKLRATTKKKKNQTKTSNSIIRIPSETMKQEYKKKKKSQPESNRRSPYDLLQDRNYRSIVKVLILPNVNAKKCHHEKGEIFPGQT